MARLTFAGPVNFSWRGRDFVGQSGKVFRIDDTLIQQFLAQLGDRLPAITWLDERPSGDGTVVDTEQRLIALESSGGGGHPNLATHDVMGLATQSELDAHEAAPDPHIVYALDADLSTHAGAGDPHSGYQKESEKGVAGGYAGLDGSGTVPDAQIPGSIARDSELPDLAGHVGAGDPHTQYVLESVAVPFARGGTVLNPAAAINVIVWRAPFACTVTAVKGYRVGGTGATVNARKNGSSTHLSSDLSLSSADTWLDGGSVQNTSYSAGDAMEIMIASVAGAPTQVAIQVDFTKP